MKAVIYALPKFEVELSKEELEAAIECANHHYDSVCQQTAKPGGFLYGGWNQIKFEELEGKFEAQQGPKANLSLTSRELGTFCKVLEFAPYSPEPPTKELGSRLYFSLRRTWTTCESRFPHIAIQVPE